jgi:hypothetical protein
LKKDSFHNTQTLQIKVGGEYDSITMQESKYLKISSG